MTDGDIIIMNEGLQWWGAEHRAIRGPKTGSLDVFCRRLARRDEDDPNCRLSAGAGSPTGNRRACISAAPCRWEHFARHVTRLGFEFARRRFTRSSAEIWRAPFVAYNSLARASGRSATGSLYRPAGSSSVPVLE
jgi:hypothetical protein